MCFVAAWHWQRGRKQSTDVTAAPHSDPGMTHAAGGYVQRNRRMKSLCAISIILIPLADCRGNEYIKKNKIYYSIRRNNYELNSSTSP